MVYLLHRLQDLRCHNNFTLLTATDKSMTMAMQIMNLYWILRAFKRFKCNKHGKQNEHKFSIYVIYINCTNLTNLISQWSIHQHYTSNREILENDLRRHICYFFWSAHTYLLTNLKVIMIDFLTYQKFFYIFVIGYDSIVNNHKF